MTWSSQLQESTRNSRGYWSHQWGQKCYTSPIPNMHTHPLGHVTSPPVAQTPPHTPPAMVPTIAPEPQRYPPRSHSAPKRLDWWCSGVCLNALWVSSVTIYVFIELSKWNLGLWLLFNYFVFDSGLPQDTDSSQAMWSLAFLYVLKAFWKKDSFTKRGEVLRTGISLKIFIASYWWTDILVVT